MNGTKNVWKTTLNKTNAEDFNINANTKDINNNKDNNKNTNSNINNYTSIQNAENMSINATGGAVGKSETIKTNQNCKQI
jgi:hypothetical protein